MIQWANAGQEKVRLMVWSPSEEQSKESGEWLQNDAVSPLQKQNPQWDITFVYGVADEATAASQVSQDPEGKRGCIYVCKRYADHNDRRQCAGEIWWKVQRRDRNRQTLRRFWNLWQRMEIFTVFRLRQIPGLCIMIRVFSLRRILKIWIPCWRKVNGVSSIYKFLVSSVVSTLEMAVRLFGDGTDESQGVDFGGEKAAEVTDYLIDLAAIIRILKSMQTVPGLQGCVTEASTPCSPVPGTPMP